MEHLSATPGSLVCYVNCNTTSFLTVFLQKVSVVGTQAREGWCVHLCFMGVVWDRKQLPWVCECNPGYMDLPLDVCVMSPEFSLEHVLPEPLIFTKVWLYW